MCGISDFQEAFKILGRSTMLLWYLQYVQSYEYVTFLLIFLLLYTRLNFRIHVYIICLASSLFVLSMYICLRCVYVYVCIYACVYCIYPQIHVYVYVCHCIYFIYLFFTCYILTHLYVGTKSVLRLCFLFCKNRL